MSNPFELRFNIYSQAEGKLLQKYYSDLTLWENKNRVGDQPEFPDSSQILTEAEKIYDFVQNKG